MPAAPDLRGSDYDDKFRILLSPRAFCQRYVVVGLRAGFVT